MREFIPPVLDRDQFILFKDSLEDTVIENHPVRVFDWVLDRHDWTDWYAKYRGGGRPAYPPDVMCKLLVYGYSKRILSSRMLEYACRNNIDFIWLMSGRIPDHDTICEFRRANAAEFKEVFATTVAACVKAGMVTLKHLAVDGTRVEANNGDRKTMSAAEIEETLQKLDRRVEKIIEEAEAEDRREDELFGVGVTPNELPDELKDVKKRQAKLERALAKVKAKTRKAVQTRGESEEKAQRKRVPVTDPDAEVMRNKKGGFGPNYNPYVAADSECGVIVAEGVTNEHHDAVHLKAAIEEAEETAGKAVAEVQADSAYATTENLRYCEERGIDPCIAPAKTRLEREGSKAEEKPWPDEAPRTATDVDGNEVDGTVFRRGSKGKFEKSAFRYDASKDRFICPLGHTLSRAGTRVRKRNGRRTARMVYRCGECRGCPFKSVCTGESKGRTVTREQDAEVHERHQARMRDPDRRDRYRLRKQTVEPVFGILKEQMKFRRFQLRGLANVRGEWSLVAAAHNLNKLALKAAGRFAAAGGSRPPPITNGALQTINNALQNPGREAVVGA